MFLERYLQQAYHNVQTTANQNPNYVNHSSSCNVCLATTNGCVRGAFPGFNVPYRQQNKYQGE